MGRSEETSNSKHLKRDHHQIQQHSSSKLAGAASWEGSPGAAVAAEANGSPDSHQSKRLKLDSDDRSEDLVSDLLGHQVRVRRRPRSSRKSGAESQGTADDDDQGSRSCSTDEEDDKAAAEALLGFSLGTDPVEQISQLRTSDTPHQTNQTAPLAPILFSDDVDVGKIPATYPTCAVTSSLPSPTFSSQSPLHDRAAGPHPSHLEDMQLPSMCAVSDNKPPIMEPLLCHVSCPTEAAMQQATLSKPSSPSLPSYIESDTHLPIMTMDAMHDPLNHRIPTSAVRPTAPMQHMTYPDLSMARATQMQLPGQQTHVQATAPVYMAPAPAPPAATPASVIETKPLATTTAAKGTGSTGKSELTVLCEKFQERFGRLHDDGSPREIMLKEVAEDLAVPRRRLYDIINVLEAVEIVVRTGKLTYEWRGLSHLPDLLDRLARDEQNGVPVQDRVRRMVHKTVVVQKEGDETGEPQRREHVTRSLWMLSRKFVRLLLTNKEPIPLVEAAAMLIGNEPGSESAVHMTVERRLYDIGSILSSLGLIEKTYLGRNSSSGSKTRQPAFQWKYRYSKMSTRVQPSLQWGQAMESLGYPVAEPFSSLPVNTHMRTSRKSGPETEAELYMMQSQNLAKQGYMTGGYGCPGFAVPYGTILMPPPMAASPHGATYMLVPSPGMEDNKAYGMAMGTVQASDAGKDQRGMAGQNGTMQRDGTEDWSGTGDAGVNGTMDGDASGAQRGARLQQQQSQQAQQAQQQRVAQGPQMMMHMPHFMPAPTMMSAMSPHMYVPPMAMSAQQGSAVCPMPFGAPMLGPPMYAQGILPNGQPALFPTSMTHMPSMMHANAHAHALGMQPTAAQPAVQHDTSQMDKHHQDPNTAATTPSSVGTEDPTETTVPSPAGVAGDTMAPTMVNGSMLYGLAGMNMQMMAMPGCVPVCMPHAGYASNMGMQHAGMHTGYAATNK